MEYCWLITGTLALFLLFLVFLARKSGIFTSGYLVREIYQNTQRGGWTVYIVSDKNFVVKGLEPMHSDVAKSGHYLGSEVVLLEDYPNKRIRIFNSWDIPLKVGDKVRLCVILRPNLSKGLLYSEMLPNLLFLGVIFSSSMACSVCPAHITEENFDRDKDLFKIWVYPQDKKPRE